MSDRSPTDDACLAIAAGDRLRVTVPTDALQGTVTTTVTHGTPVRDALPRRQYVRVRGDDGHTYTLVMVREGDWTHDLQP